ncbi:thermonuclease family protein [Mesorhizobium sp.]|uniref:thermonuclease family protein n=1 Tax=Mesorhizobium sp. TaxID=1871066 RepID=UPI0025C18CAC|nr:thermonuclease family protein [Mesorhizobium sp.]
MDTFLAASRPLHCTFVDRDRYGRLVGDCERADGRGVQQWLVEQGLALDWPKYSSGIYASQQAAAKAAKRGIWAGTFQEPWDWRAEHHDQGLSGKPLGLVSPSALAVGSAPINSRSSHARTDQKPAQPPSSETACTDRS